MSNSPSDPANPAANVSAPLKKAPDKQPDQQSAKALPALPIALHYLLQPLLAGSAVWFWLDNRDNPAVYLPILLGGQLLLLALERWRPARTDWQQLWPEKLRNLGIVAVGITASVAVATLYASWLAEPLAQLRNQLHINLWPTHWPLLTQVVLCAFLSEFIWYWLHRAEHRWPLVWKLSGHGAHHSFKHLEAINFGANHPMEYLVLAVPSLLLELLFGAGIAAAGSVVLITIQASIVHANLSLNSTGIDWLFTTNTNHIRHHSIEREESNTNYGCAIILWDRLFGTYATGPTTEAGIGPIEPTLWQKLLMPLLEPQGSQIAPGGQS